MTTVLINIREWIEKIDEVMVFGIEEIFFKVADTNCHTVWMYMKHIKQVFDEQARVASLQD